MVTSIYHLILKFPTPSGVESIKGSQFDSMEYNNQAIKGFWKLYKPHTSNIVEEEPDTHRGKNAVNCTYKISREDNSGIQEDPHQDEEPILEIDMEGVVRRITNDQEKEKAPL